jgi:lysozyme family protein
MADFETAIVKTLAREGGAKITDDPNDRGGVTRYGISSRAYPNVDIRNLTEQQACNIYKREYWDKVRGDDILSQDLAEIIFDSAVNMGEKTTIKLLQSAIPMNTIDGIFGPKTLNCVNGLPPDDTIKSFILLKIARYVKICETDASQKKYFFGWIRRTLS